MRRLPVLLLLGLAGVQAARAAEPDELSELSLEELGRIEVSSVSRRSERLDGIAASIYVISAESLQRAGASTLAEALRLAPNLQVARAGAANYAISARGFNNLIANKLLVLVDGRVIYAPYFSGVHWEQQDLPLDEVARIEVISGPGASVWGANAVNGVINVISKPARDSLGWRIGIGSGSESGLANLRHGGSLGGDGRYRVYARMLRLQPSRSEAGQRLQDGRRHAQFGWRADWLQGVHGLTLQGDWYRGRSDARGSAALALGPLQTRGHNLLARWTRPLSDGAQLRLRAYVDHSEREDRLLYSPRSTVLDLDAQHSLRLGEHQIDWGGGLRRAHDRIRPGLLFGFVPERERQTWLNLFAQDELRLADSLRLIAGLKLERNDYSGWESLPNLRLAWSAKPRQLWWASLSRAVRAPSRLDRDLRLPPRPPLLIAGGPDFVAEVARVVEIGHRAQPWPAISYSLTLFHHDWQRLRSGQVPPNAQVQNRIAGSSRGLEAWAQWQAMRWLRLEASVSALGKNLRVEPGSNDPEGPRALGNDPRHQWSLRAQLDLPARQELDLALRRIGALPDPALPAYTALDLNYGWRPRADWRLSLSGRNLLGGQHAEFGTAPGRARFGRSVFLQLQWTP